MQPHVDTSGVAALAPAYAPWNYLNAPATGVRSWLETRDHKRIGVMFLAATTAFFALGGLFAVLTRFELLTPGATIMEATTYERLVTLHGVVMIFLFLIPAIPSGFGNFLLPLMLGAKDVAFPRLNLLSFYAYVAGAAIALSGMVLPGGDPGGLPAPYSTASLSLPTLLGLLLVAFSSILTALDFIVTTHTLRAPGMTWMRLPLFVWSIYATSLVQILALPVLSTTLLLVAVERASGWGILDPALLQHLFSLYAQPAVYVMVLPAMAVISEVVCAFSRKSIFGYRAVVYSSLGIAFVGFFTRAHRLFTSGESIPEGGIFGVLSMLVGVLTAVVLFHWLATLYEGQLSFKTPFAYLLGFLFFLVFGGMTGVALATVSLDVHWRDTYFVVAHLHFVLVGGVLMAFLAALHYWFPKITGRMYPERWGLVAATLIFLGMTFTFVPQFLLGNMGLPRRSFAYPARYQALNVASTAGASVLAIGLLVVLVYTLVAMRHGPAAGPNPWRSRGFEWETPSPPPPDNYETTPLVTHGPHEYDAPAADVSPQGHAPDSPLGGRL